MAADPGDGEISEEETDSDFKRWRGEAESIRSGMFAADIFATEQIAVHGRKKMELNLISTGKYIAHGLFASYGIMLLGFFVEGIFRNSRKVEYFFVTPTLSISDHGQACAWGFCSA